LGPLPAIAWGNERVNGGLMGPPTTAPTSVHPFTCSSCRFYVRCTSKFMRCPRPKGKGWIEGIVIWWVVSRFRKKKLLDMSIFAKVSETFSFSLKFSRKSSKYFYPPKLIKMLANMKSCMPWNYFLKISGFTSWCQVISCLFLRKVLRILPRKFRYYVPYIFTHDFRKILFSRKCANNFSPFQP
jgi:hypothetical protein